ncbi:cyclin-A1 [Chanos chanos]|uniref:Cyclin-A1 n=1 Tax=Chanos chanos TaxID=29144 RepID=A0A6J2WV34_CHACN|nr:cyclin-A1 [Chanos chanos]
MSFGGRAPLASRSSQDNILVPRGIDGPRVQKVGQRVVLGVLNENEPPSRVSNAGAKCVSTVNNPTGSKKVLTCLSTSATGVYVDKPREVHSDTSLMVAEELQLLEDVENNVYSGSCMDTSMQSLSEDDQYLLLQDISFAEEYAEEIHQHLRDSEVKCRPKPGYMSKQPDITTFMRTVLVDWLVEVSEEYRLCSETIYLAVNYLDRFLSCMSVLRGKLQLVGTAAILLAAKYEEIYPPEVDEFVYITDDTYTKRQLLRMEHLLLKVLAFDMSVPTSHQFLMQYMMVESVCNKTANLALYLSELSLLDVDPFVQYVPSKVAAAAYCLANYTLNRSLWPEALYAFTGYTLAEISPCLKALHKLYLSAENRPQQAIREKYKSSKYCSVSLIKPVESLPLP